MSMTDPVADLLTRIRNAQRAGLEEIDLPASRMKQRICEVLRDEGFVREVSLKQDEVQGTLEGPKGKVSQKLDREMKVTVDKGEVRVDRPDDSRRSRQLHGLTRTLVANMIQGVTTGFSRSLDISGVGYKAELKGKEIHLALGYSHPVVYPLPEGVSAEYDAKGNRLTVKGADKHQIGLVAAEIRKLRPPEPYKGKGIKYAEETIRRKQGKTGAA
jgi:large subunit ribosomal protein L6